MFELVHHFFGDRGKSGARMTPDRDQALSRGVQALQSHPARFVRGEIKEDARRLVLLFRVFRGIFEIIGDLEGESQLSRISGQGDPLGAVFGDASEVHGNQERSREKGSGLLGMHPSQGLKRGVLVQKTFCCLSAHHSAGADGMQEAS